MKLVELLARELKDWPKKYKYSVCDKDGEIRLVGHDTKLDFYQSVPVCLEDRLSGYAKLGDDKPRVTREMWQAERDRIADIERPEMDANATKAKASSANKDGWIRHRGGKCPVEKGALVDVRFRNGDIIEGIPALESHGSSHPYSWSAGIEFWKKDDVAADIMAYRLHKPAEQVEACSKPELRSLPENYGEIIGGSVEGPIQWRDRITEIDATTQALTTERAELVQKLASDGFALIAAAVDPAVDPVEDMSDWRNWRAGDFVTVVIENDERLKIGSVQRIRSVEKSSYDGVMPVSVWTANDDWSWPEPQDEQARCVFKFHSRPTI